MERAMVRVAARAGLWMGLIVSAVGCVSTASEPDLELGGGVRRLEVLLSQVERGSGRIEYSLINHTGSPLHVLRWKTPFDGQSDRLFSIERDGRRAMFLGPIAHRLTPTAQDYLELGPGERKTIEVDLAASYDLSGGGVFEVSSNVSSRELLRELDTVEVHSKPLSVEVGSGMSKGMVQVAGQRQALVSSECTWDQTVALAQSQSGAAYLAEEAMFAYNANAHDERAHLYFGNQPQSSVDTIRTRLANMNAGLWHDHVTYSCNGWQCVPGSPAHVFEWLQGWMFICPLFFQVSWDEQDFTILHETAHLAGAWGDQYGFDAVRNLAQNDLPAAVGNAENYAYYIFNP